MCLHPTLGATSQRKSRVVPISGWPAGTCARSMTLARVSHAPTTSQSCYWTNYAVRIPQQKGRGRGGANTGLPQRFQAVRLRCVLGCGPVPSDAPRLQLSGPLYIAPDPLPGSMPLVLYDKQYCGRRRVQKNTSLERVGCNTNEQVNTWTMPSMSARLTVKCCMCRLLAEKKILSELHVGAVCEGTCRSVLRQI